MNKDCASLNQIDFVTEQSSRLPNDLIQYGEININRSEGIFKLNSILLNLDISKNIEAGIFEYSLINVHTNNFKYDLVYAIYQDKLQNICHDLTKSEVLKQNVESGRLKPKIIAFMTQSQLCPDKWDDILTKKRMIEEKAKNIATTDLYKCHKCGQRKSTVRYLQTRCADEPMTIFVTCCNCHNTFTTD